jgi:hypothetical protein
MKYCSLYYFLVSKVLIGAVFANENSPFEGNGQLENLLDPIQYDGFDDDDIQIEKLDPSHRDLFLKGINQRRCIAREPAEFNEMFDAIAYRDMVISDSGMDVHQLRKAKKEAGDEFNQTPEYMALMAALEKHSDELKQVEQIISACQYEANGGNSAVGAGALVGARFAQALVPEQTSDPPSVSMSPSSTPSSIPSFVPTPAPQFTDYPTYIYPTWSPTGSGAGTPIFIGVHFEASLFLEVSDAFFITGAERRCLGLTTGLGGDVSLIVMISTTPNLYKYPCSQMVGIDAGLGASVGAASGAFSNYYYGFDGPPVFQVTIGVGAGFSVDLSGCRHFWRGLGPDII